MSEIQRLGEAIGQLALRQEADTAFLRLIAGMVLADSPASVARLRLLLPKMDDLTLQYSLTDDQREYVRANLQQVLALIDANPIPGDSSQDSK